MVEVHSDGSLEKTDRPTSSHWCLQKQNIFYSENPKAMGIIITEVNS